MIVSTPGCTPTGGNRCVADIGLGPANDRKGRDEVVGAGLARQPSQSSSAVRSNGGFASQQTYEALIVRGCYLRRELPLIR